MSASRFRPLGARLAVAFAVSFTLACGDDTSTTAEPSDPALGRGGVQGPDLSAAIRAQTRHTERLLATAGIEGTGVGVDAAGRPVVRVFVEHGAVRAPTELDGLKVETEVTGKFRAILPQAKPGGSGAPKPTSRFTRPVPIGVSTGNRLECASGTIGARVKIGSAVYALSNNHVFARENAGKPGEPILQPGRYDTNCASADGDVFGSLHDFQAMTFSTSANNRIDAAIAATTTSQLGNATTSAGYGTPSSITQAAAVGLPVQKCGRTTGCTTGTVTTLNATVNVSYTTGTARFVGQIVISGNKGSFSNSGDSGSLIVTNDANARPVALLFAGSRTVTIGNPINDVLSRFNATIDGPSR